jgi:hypothetical protein
VDVLKHIQIVLLSYLCPIHGVTMNQFIPLAILVLSALDAVTAAPAAASSNPLRGGPGLIGYSPTNTVPVDNTETISFQYAPGQTANPDLGLYLNFEEVENPQPIRGDTGGTNPGPGMQLIFLKQEAIG